MSPNLRSDGRPLNTEMVCLHDGSEIPINAPELEAVREMLKRMTWEEVYGDDLLLMKDQPGAFEERYWRLRDDVSLEDFEVAVDSV